MLEGLEVAPERGDLAIHHPDILEPDGVHPVGDVGHAEPVKKLEHSSVLIQSVYPTRYEAPAAACRVSRRVFLRPEDRPHGPE